MKKSPGKVGAKRQPVRDAPTLESDAKAEHRRRVRGAMAPAVSIHLDDGVVDTGHWTPVGPRMVCPFSVDDLPPSLVLSSKHYRVLHAPILVECTHQLPFGGVR